VDTVLNYGIQSICYIDNRDFTGVNNLLPPGPFSYQQFIYSDAISVVPNVMFFLNTCLADGLFLYRCWVIYTYNNWVIAFPCLMYLASSATGIMTIYYQVLPPFAVLNPTGFSFSTACSTISLSLTVILTIMIAVRLILHERKIRRIMGTSTTAGGLYTVVAPIVAMLVESYTLYAINFLLFVGPWGAGSGVENVFFPILIETQVIAPFLIVLRVANRTAFTSDSLVNKTVSLIRFKSHRKSTGVHETLPDGTLMSSMETSFWLA